MDTGELAIDDRPANTTLMVCRTCASLWQNSQRVGQSGGEKLLAEITRLQQTLSPSPGLIVKPVDCMSACSHACTVSFSSPRKYTYVFGDLPVDEASIHQTAAAILSCAVCYTQKSDGLIPWSERPEPLKKGVLARIPSI